MEYSRRGKNGFGTRIGSRARIVFGSVYSSQYFRDRYSEDRLHYGVMDSVNELKGAFDGDFANNEKQYSNAIV